ncbi:MAG: CC_3452 family protein [Henriciella sp.]
MIRTLTAASFAIALTGAAFAGTAFTAKLESPMPKTKKIVAAKALWKCSADTCVAELNRKAVRISTCKKVVKEVGKLAEFSNGDETLSAKDLARCNAEAKS